MSTSITTPCAGTVAAVYDPRNVPRSAAAHTSRTANGAVLATPVPHASKSLHASVMASGAGERLKSTAPYAPLMSGTVHTSSMPKLGELNWRRRWKGG